MKNIMTDEERRKSHRVDYVAHRSTRLAHMAAYYAANRDACRARCRAYSVAHRDERRVRDQAAQAAVDAYKISLGCSSCGYGRCAAALDFHHKDPAGKERRINAKQWILQTPIVAAEMKKCILLCANCHREAHHAPAMVRKP
jgi:hypothetical protein